MVDPKQVKKKVLLRILGSPQVLIPFMGGVTLFTGVLVFSQRATLAFFALVAGALGATGTFFSRLIFSGESVSRTVLQESLEQEKLSRQNALDQLHQRLCLDDDPRPEAALEDLRSLLRAFEEGPMGTTTQSISFYEVSSLIGQLFEHSVKSLEQTIQLLETAAKLNTAEAKNPILEHREKIISEVQESIKSMSKTLVELQRLDGPKQSQAALGRIRDELDQSLTAARNVEARINSLLSTDSYKPVDLRDNPQQ